MARKIETIGLKGGRNNSCTGIPLVSCDKPAYLHMTRTLVVNATLKKDDKQCLVLYML
jgi:hypothetical protein